MRQSQPAKRSAMLAMIVLFVCALFCIVYGISLYFTKGIPTVYWSVAPNIYVAPFIIITVGLSLLALIVVWIFRRFQFGLFIIAGIFSCMFLFSLYWGNMTHQDTVTFNDRIYHLALSDDAQWSDYILCKCDSSGILCQCHAFYSLHLFGRPASNTLSVDNTTNELKVKAGDDVIYIDGTFQQCFPIDGECLDK